MYKIGISTCGDKPIDLKGFTAMKEAGMGAVEICLSDYKELDFKKVKADADATGIVLYSIHSHMRADEHLYTFGDEIQPMADAYRLRKDSRYTKSATWIKQNLTLFG